MAETHTAHCGAGVGAGSFKTYVIGDLLEADARAFLTEDLLRPEHPAISDEQWRVVYEVCGFKSCDLTYWL